MNSEIPDYILEEIRSLQDALLTALDGVEGKVLRASGFFESGAIDDDRFYAAWHDLLKPAAQIHQRIESLIAPYRPAGESARVNLPDIKPLPPFDPSKLLWPTGVWAGIRELFDGPNAAKHGRMMPGVPIELAPQWV